ncbi:trypco2 family protein [Streptomyces sp. NPDC007808]|uniref:trypco2 family protein n=1 Tax=Streptomyces sp. NPDC007808 TaxID=3364779 RepID=UPI0036850C37
MAEAIDNLRRELYAAESQGAHEQFAFEVEEAQLELMLELREEGRGGGKLQFGVATIDANDAVASARTHKLVLKLKVKDRARAGQQVVVNDEEQGIPWDEDD